MPPHLLAPLKLQKISRSAEDKWGINLHQTSTVPSQIIVNLHQTSTVSSQIIVNLHQTSESLSSARAVEGTEKMYGCPRQKPITRRRIRVFKNHY